MEIIDATLLASGYPDAKTVLEQRWVDEMPSFRTAHFLDGFATTDRRFHFAPDWAALGDKHGVMPRLPDQMDNIEADGPDAPFRLVTAPARSFLNTSFTEMASGKQREGRPTGADASRRCEARWGSPMGSKVRLGNVRGEVVLHARDFGWRSSRGCWFPRASGRANVSRAG